MKLIQPFLALFLPGLALLPTACSEDKPVAEQHPNSDDRFDLYRFTHAEEPYLAMTRTVQLLDVMGVSGWGIAHIKGGQFEVWVHYNGKWELLEQADIKPFDAGYLFLHYEQTGGSLTLHHLTNTSNGAVSMKSPFASAGEFRTAPIPAVDGTYTLFDAYDKKGKIIIKLSGTSPAQKQTPKETPEDDSQLRKTKPATGN